MADAAGGGPGRVAGAGQGAAGRRVLEGSQARPPEASAQPAWACCSRVCVERCSMLMLAAFGGVCSNGGTSARVRSVVGDGVRAHERVLAGLVRAVCSVARCACHADDRVEGRVCRNGTMGEKGGKNFSAAPNLASAHLAIRSAEPHQRSLSHVSVKSFWLLALHMLTSAHSHVGSLAAIRPLG